MLPLPLIIAALVGWIEREQRDLIEFLREENRVLKAQLHGRRMRLSDDERRRLAVIGQRLGRRVLAHVATIVTPDTILRWHRELIARKWTSVRSRPGRPGVQVEIRRLAIRMATDNPSWGYTRIQGALKNVGRQAADRAVRQQFVHAQESRQRPPVVGDEQGSAPRVSRRITATSMEPRAFWSAGPLFTSATSPQPIIPQRIVSLTPISVVSEYARDVRAQQHERRVERACRTRSDGE